MGFSVEELGGEKTEDSVKKKRKELEIKEKP